MILLQTHRLSKSFAGETILNDIHLEVQTNERIGLVGRNGAGKSTLLKIITGQLAGDVGQIFIAKQTRIGYLAQDSGLDSQATVWEELKKVFGDLVRQEQQLRRMEARMADPDLLRHKRQYEALMAEYDRSQELFKRRGGYEYEARINSVLQGLGFADQKHHAVSALSGGQKTRLALGKLLLEKPELLILDEPTNYLDLETLSWLEQYLLAYPGAMLVVSHDRYFLDKLVDTVYELEGTKINKYPGNYARFLEQKQKNPARQLKRYEKQQKDIQRMNDFIQRNMARASTSKRAQGRRKMLEKMERIDRPHMNSRNVAFAFEVARPSGEDVFKVRELSIGYPGQNPLAENMTFQVYKGDRLAIIGPNGIGKTTLLKTIVGQLPPLKGHIHPGAHVTIAYYDQEQHHLDAGNTVLEEIWNDDPQMKEKDVRSLLGQFLFSGEDVEKPVGSLSGGEKARLSLAKLMLKKANVLILDEPTNHLDVYSKEVLEQSLDDYPGTLLFVSHDRYFLNRMATKVLELQPTESRLYLGNYDYYVYKKDELNQIALKKQEIDPAAQISTTTKKAGGKSSFEQKKERQKMERKRKRRIKELENQIAAWEEMITDLEQQLVLPEVYQDFQKARDIQEQINQLKKNMDETYAEWMALEETAD